jgi:hypothetical protein
MVPIIANFNVRQGSGPRLVYFRPPWPINALVLPIGPHARHEAFE